MRASSLSLVFGLILLMARTSEAQPAPVPLNCCFKFIDFQIPENKIVRAVSTNSVCPAAGIVVTTEKQNQFCVKPDAAWVKKHLQ